MRALRSLSLPVSPSLSLGVSLSVSLKGTVS